METPLLDGARVRLAPFADRHLSEAYVGWLNDAEVMRYSEQRHFSHDLESCDGYRRSMLAAGNPFWAIEWKQRDGRHIGNVGAVVDPWNALAELSILLGDREAWGAGLGAEAWGLAQDWLLGDGGLRKIFAGTLACNAAMLSVMRKTGMVEEGVMKAQYVLDGEPVDAVMAAKFR